MSSDTEFADFLRGLPREVAEVRVAEIEKQHDAERGGYIPHHHHVYFEGSRH